jgi:tetratricopeptide (TPR) repeat protein
MGQVFRAYHRACTGAVERWGGQVAKYMGDGVLAYFGWPQAHEDDAERAVRAGLELADEVGKLDTPAGKTLAARIGIATGLVMVGELIGEGVAQEQAVVGETPNLAARLQALASPGTVVIGQGTRSLLGGLFELADLGPQRLKGFAEPLAAFEVVGEGRLEGRFEALRGERLIPLVGREQEIALLLDRWQLAKGGQGQVVSLSGDPGIGKSRIARALRERLVGEPHTRLSYYCSPHHTHTSLRPVIDQLERAAEFNVHDSADAKLDKLEAVLADAGTRVAAAAPLLATLFSVPIEGRYPAQKLTPQMQKARTFEAFIEQLEGLAARQPVLMILEDAHWIDSTSTELFDLVIDRIQRLPVLLVITFRPEFSPPWTGHDHVVYMTLSRLRRHQGMEIVLRVAGKNLPAELVEHILVKTDGVPLFVEELTKTVLESNFLTEAGDHYELSGPLPFLAIPATLQDSLMARLDRLAPVKEIAQLGAAIGRAFSYELLSAVAPFHEDRLRHSLDQLVASELVFRRGTFPTTTYIFKHALVQEAAYQSMLKNRRRQLHGRIAAVLEERFEDAQRQPELLAHHYREAGLLENAIPYATQAGDLAFGRVAFVEARGRYQEALDMAQALPSSEQGTRLQIQAMLKLAHIHQLLGEFGHLPPKEAYPKAKDAAMKALALDPTSAEAHYVLAIISGLYDWDWARSERTYKRALELDPDNLRVYQDYGILLLTPLGRHDEAISYLNRALELDPLISWTKGDLANALNQARQPDRAYELSLSVIERDPMFAPAHRQLALACIQLGKYEDALAEFRKTVELTGGEVFPVAQLGWAYGVVGQTDEAQKVLDQLKSRARKEHVDPLAFAWLSIGLGDKEAAFSWLDSAYDAKSSWLIFLKGHQIYDPLRSDFRFQDLLRRLQLDS